MALVVLSPCDPEHPDPSDLERARFALHKVCSDEVFAACVDLPDFAVTVYEAEAKAAYEYADGCDKTTWVGMKTWTLVQQDPVCCTRRACELHGALGA